LVVDNVVGKAYFLGAEDKSNLSHAEFVQCQYCWEMFDWRMLVPCSWSW